MAVAIWLLVIPAHALAYLDPASGSMALQVAVGGILSLIAVVKIYWKKLVRMVRGTSDTEPGETAEIARRGV
jgi:hypothetical protein